MVSAVRTCNLGLGRLVRHRLRPALRDEACVCGRFDLRARFPVRVVCLVLGGAGGVGASLVFGSVSFAGGLGILVRAARQSSVRGLVVDLVLGVALADLRVLGCRHLTRRDSETSEFGGWSALGGWLGGLAEGEGAFLLGGGVFALVNLVVALGLADEVDEGLLEVGVEVLHDVGALRGGEGLEERVVDGLVRLAFPFFSGHVWLGVR